MGLLGKRGSNAYDATCSAIAVQRTTRILKGNKRGENERAKCTMERAGIGTVKEARRFEDRSIGERNLETENTWGMKFVPVRKGITRKIGPLAIKETLIRSGHRLAVCKCIHLRCVHLGLTLLGHSG